MNTDWRRIIAAKLGPNSEAEEYISMYNDSFVLTDPDIKDNPLVYVSESFEKHTGYTAGEVIGKNCRFLQGNNPVLEQVQQVRNLIKREEQGVVHLTNYAKDGTEFSNIFLLVPIKKGGKTVFFLGAQGFRILANKKLKSNFDRVVDFLFPEKTTSSEIILTSNSGSTRANELPLTFSSDFSTGVAFLKTKQDRPQARFSKCFEGTEDLFDFQIQFIIVKEIPLNYEVFLGIEVRKNLQLSLTMKTLAAAAVSTFLLFHSGMHVSYGNINSEESEYSHMCFPFHMIPDSLIISSDKEVAPDLSSSRISTCRQKYEISFRKNYTYTCSVSSSMLNLEKWKLLNLPGIKSLNMTKFWGNDSVHVVSYAVPRGSQKHLIKERLMLFDLEISNNSLKN